MLSFGGQADCVCVRSLTALFFIQGSVPSLAAGLLFGGLAGLGAYQQSKDPKNVWLSLVASGTLSTVMGMRFYNSKKAMPGIIAGASLLMVGRLGLQMMEKPLKP